MTEVKDVPGVKYEKMLRKMAKERKLRLLTEFTISLEEMRETVEPWIEVIDDKKFVLKQIQNVTSFGTLILLFEEQHNPENQIRLPLQLKL